MNDSSGCIAEIADGLTLEDLEAIEDALADESFIEQTYQSVTTES